MQFVAHIIVAIAETSYSSPNCALFRKHSPNVDEWEEGLFFRMEEFSVTLLLSFDFYL